MFEPSPSVNKGTYEEDIRNIKTMITFAAPIIYVGRIADFKRRWKLKSRSEVIRQLIDTALFLEKKIAVAETWTSKDLQEIREQLEHGQLVEYFAHMDNKLFHAILEVARNELKIRQDENKRQSKRGLI